MQVSSKLLVKTVIVLLGMLLAISVFVALNSSQKAGALNASEWETVRSYMSSYIANQWTSGAEGEAGFTLDASALKSRIDSNNDGVYLGEGDNAVGAPVLVDSLISQTTVIPGTNARCSYNNATGGNCFDAAQITTIKNKVNAHEAAGFSTDISNYCLTGHTEAPATGAFGIIAQTGALGGSTTPKVVAFKWGRKGWDNTYGTAAYGENNNLGAASSTSSYAAAGNAAQCNGVTPDSELVRCIAQWAMLSSGGNVGNGISPTGTAPNQTLAASQIVDVRSGSPASTIAITGKTTVQVPVETIFNTGGSALNTSLTGGTTGIIFAGRTQHVGGIVAVGAKMLGYPVGTGGFLNNGMPNYNGTLDEKWVSGTAYPLVTGVTANNATSGIDTTVPVQSAVGHSNVTTSSADISRHTSEPASIRVDYGTAPGVYTQTEKHTVLNADKTLTLSGLADGTTYYYTVTSYDGVANASSTSSEGSFTTESACTAGKPSLSLGAPSAFWASYADYTDKQLSVTWTVSNTGSTVANAVQIDSSDPVYAAIITMTPMPAVIGGISAGASDSTVIKYQLPVYGPGFRVVNTGSATDCAANSYTYP